jgi:FAD dependent oxidoreductase TIGR03364
MDFDVAIVGAGIVGLAHALAARRRGFSVVVIDREARPIGASIRNFGFVTVTGQRRGETWARARRSAEVWDEIAPRAGIAIEHRGLVLLARRPEAQAVLEAFCVTEMGEACALLTAAEVAERFPDLKPESLCAALQSPHDLRVESRTAIPKLITWLASIGVTFRFSTAVRAIAAPVVETARGEEVRAETILVCPGDDLATLFPDLIAAHGVTRCVLQMLRLESPGWRLPGAVMSDLSLVRYRGYADLAESAPLRARLEADQADALTHGVHLIVVQSEDGSLVVGDSHHYAASPEPFAARAVEQIILREAQDTLGCAPAVRDRWIGTYGSADRDMFRASPAPNVHMVMVTSGTGASTAFGIAEETFATLMGPATKEELP